MAQFSLFRSLRGTNPGWSFAGAQESAAEAGGGAYSDPSLEPSAAALGPPGASAQPHAPSSPGACAALDTGWVHLELAPLGSRGTSEPVTKEYR